MPMFVKQTSPVEAFQFKEGYFQDAKVPKGFKMAVCRKDDATATFLRPHVHTKGGLAWITVGEWIVKNGKLDYSVIPDEVFKKEYVEF